jgi:hypothetical protein
MVGHWPQVTTEMINQHRQGHPEINSFDPIKHEMSEQEPKRERCSFWLQQRLKLGGEGCGTPK